MRNRDMTELYTFLSGEKVNWKIRFSTEMETIFDLSYFLIDFQAIVNGLAEVVDSCNNLYYMRDYISTDEELIAEYNERDKENDSHPNWQREVVDLVEETIFWKQKPVVKVAENRSKGRKSTTTRNFNKKYRDEWELNSFSKGSLVLDLTTDLINYLLTEFVKAIVIKKTGREDAVNIDFENCLVLLDDARMQNLPERCTIRNSVVIIGDSGYRLDVKDYVNKILEEVQPDEDVEGSINRLLEVLHAKGVINQYDSYDSKGAKTVVYDVDRMMKSSFDIRV